MSELSIMAPRLHQAHCEMKAQMRDDELVRKQYLDEFTKLNKLVIHRDLQLIRAFYTNDRSYIAKRQKMFDQAMAAKKRLVYRGPVYRDLFA